MNFPEEGKPGRRTGYSLFPECDWQASVHPPLRKDWRDYSTAQGQCQLGKKSQNTGNTNEWKKGGVGSKSDQHAVAVVDLVLGDLRRPAFQRSKADAEALVLITHLDLTETSGLSGSRQGKEPSSASYGPED